MSLVFHSLNEYLKLHEKSSKEKEKLPIYHLKSLETMSFGCQYNVQATDSGNLKKLNLKFLVKPNMSLLYAKFTNHKIR